MLVTQPNMQAHEDLAALFSRNLNLNPVPVQIKEEEEQQPKITYSISQHYHHSAHAVRAAQEQPSPQVLQRPASEPPPELEATETILVSHGVDPSALSSAQLELFKTGEDEQKWRLIQLWSICPPTKTTDNPALAWGNTTMEQEETLARMRFERIVQEEQAKTAMSLDGTPVPAPMQGGDGRWLMANTHHYMEPYMSSGYEELARREYMASAEEQQRPTDVYSHFGTSAGGHSYKPATDPVYQNTNGPADWQQQQQQQQQEQTAAMENQYGAIMAMREMEY